MKKMEAHTWVREFPAELTLCDQAGLLLEMNDAAEAGLSEDGRRTLLERTSGRPS